MEPGPSTARLDTVASELGQRLHQRNLKTATATDPEGRLAGVVRLADLDR
jgi:CBS-domain-containing membrane protein